MKKYLFLFGINALILLALSANAVMTIMASCSASGQCTAAVTPLTWGMAVLPVVILVGIAVYFAPRALRSRRAGQAERKEAKLERAAVAELADDADNAAQARLHRFARAQAVTSDSADVEAEPSPDHFTDAAEDTAGARVDADPSIEPAADAVAEDSGSDPMVWPVQTASHDHPAPYDESGDAAIRVVVQDPFEDADTADISHGGKCAADTTAAQAGQEDWDEVFPRLGASAFGEPDEPVEGPWDWLMTEGQVDQLRPAAQTGFPWVAATIAEMAGAILEQARADRLGQLLPEVEAWLAIAGELAPDDPIEGEDAAGFVGWVNDLAVHCHMAGEPVGVATLLAQAMDRLADRARDDGQLASALPPQVFASPPEWDAFAKAG